MPPRRHNCQICSENQFRYVCSKCDVLYCSVPCFKVHKDKSCTERKGDVASIAISSGEATQGPPSLSVQGSSTLRNSNEEMERLDSNSPKAPLRPLTSLKWPYVPDASSYPDPLTRDDPKTLSLAQYEDIATSSSIREVLSSHPCIPRLLRALDSLRGSQREEALQNVLGISQTQTPGPLRDYYIQEDVKNELVTVGENEMKALKALAEAIEQVLRSTKDETRSEALGLDWEDVNMPIT